MLPLGRSALPTVTGSHWSRTVKNHGLPMKITLKEPFRSHERYLLAKGDKDDNVDYNDLKRIQLGDIRVFLPIESTDEGNHLSFTYLASSYCTLGEYTKNPVDTKAFRSMILSILDVIQKCEDNDLSRCRVDFSFDHVFFDESTRILRFAYIPLVSFIAPETETDLLKKLCSLDTVTAANPRISSKMLDFVSRTPLLTGVELESFLIEQGLLASAEKRRSLSRSFASTKPTDSRKNYGLSFTDGRIVGKDEAGAGTPAAAAAAASVTSAGQVRQATPSPTTAPAASAVSASPRTAPIILVAESMGKGFKLQPGTYVIGRDESCDICLEGSRGISRRHATITIEARGTGAGQGGSQGNRQGNGQGNGPRIIIQDNGSTNGTFVDGKRLQPHSPAEIVQGSKLQLGDVPISFRET